MEHSLLLTVEALRISSCVRSAGSLLLRQRHLPPSPATQSQPELPLECLFPNVFGVPLPDDMDLSQGISWLLNSKSLPR